MDQVKQDDVARAAPASPVVEAEVPQDTRNMIHTRSCNGRDICSCFLRLQSAYFQKNLGSKRKQKAKLDARLTAKAAADSTAASATTDTATATGKAGIVQTPPRKKKRVPNAYRKVTNLQQFDTQVVAYLATFLRPADLAQLSMANKAMKNEIEEIAQRDVDSFVSAPAREAIVLKDEKRKTETWTRYLHVQMRCVHRMFVYYTGYKTGQMRRDFPFWSFGVVDVDPNDPSAAVLPNTWKFHDHKPWLPQRANGKDGEWRLRDGYKRERQSAAFRQHVKEWAITLRPGSFVAVAYQNAGSTEPAWWEAQVWHVWRAKEDPDPITVYDAATDTTLHVRPEDLLTHFQQNPLHVVDVCSTPRKLCWQCARGNKSFYHCHVERGHPML